MDPQLQRAYDALQQADAAGNKEDAQQIADYIRELQIQQQNKAMLEAGEESMMENPIAAGAVGAFAGPVAGKVLETAYGPKGVTTAPSGGASPMAGAPGQKYAAKTGYGAGTGETVRDVVEEFKKQEAPLGKGKVTSKIKGGPLGGPAAMQQIASKEADAARFAQMRAANQVAAQKAASVPNRLAQATAGKMPLLLKSAAGAGAGVQASDAWNRLQQNDYLGAGLGAIGALGSAASLIPHPITRIGGTAIGMGAGALNAYIDYLKSKAQPQQPAAQPMKDGGIVGYARGKAVKQVFTPVVTKIVKASEALGPNEGKYLLPTQSDRMRSTMGDLGGSGFSKFQLEKPEYAEAKAAWGVGKKPTATGIVNVNKKYGDQAVWTPMLGSETQHHSNQHVFDMLAEEFNRQARMGNLPKELQERINTRLATAKNTKGLFPEEFDIGNPEHLIKYGDTFNRRGALSTIMSGEGVGGTKGRIIDYPGIMQEMTDPMTLGAPTHSLGTRLFTLNNEIEYRPDLHSAFPYILKGTDQGVAFAPVPKELGIPDFINKFREFKGREPGYYDLVRTIPSQQITDKYLRSLEAAGYKEGGSTTPAWQRKEGKSPSGGLNALGRASYKRETGGELKAPQPEGGSRKKSFCARMGGMKKKLTSSKTANDPDSRINKALRKWKC